MNHLKRFWKSIWRLQKSNFHRHSEQSCFIWLTNLKFKSCMVSSSYLSILLTFYFYRSHECILGHGHLHTGQLCCHFFLTSGQHGGEYLKPKLHPGGGLFSPWFFIILKNSHQDLSIEGSKFILSSLDGGHWVAQT